MSCPVETPERVGDYIQTFSGKRFYPFDPRPEDICIKDIAHALANQCRFAGHTSVFYSVAEHSVRVSWECPPEYALWGLLHDAPEAYVIDLPRPIKRHDQMLAYREAEWFVWEAVCERFGLKDGSSLGYYELPTSVHRADETLLATEARDLMGNAVLERWDSLRGIEPLPEAIVPWTPTHAKFCFLARFTELTNGR